MVLLWICAFSDDDVAELTVELKALQDASAQHKATEDVLV